MFLKTANLEIKRSGCSLKIYELHISVSRRSLARHRKTIKTSFEHRQERTCK